MTPQGEFVTVFRSGDPDADAQAAAARERLASAGLAAVVVGDDAPGVVVGTREVRVPAEEAARAEELLAASEPVPEDEFQVTDTSHDLDLLPVFSSQNRDAEMEANAVAGILEASGISAVVVGSPQIPVVPFEVRVPRVRLEEARRVIVEAREAGSEGAEEAESQTEPGAESEETV
ncbi:MAG: hypothetical protein ACE141_18775 [Bryobacteraceae bacterium]|nr:hypothetical protein [Bryobacterales bacterium]